MTTHFRDKNHKSKKEMKNPKMLTTILKLLDTIVISAITSNYIVLTLTGIFLVMIPKSTGIACGLTISNNVILEIVVQKYNKNKKQYQKVQQTVNSFVKIYSLQDNMINENEYKPLCNVFTEYLEEKKIE